MPKVLQKNPASELIEYRCSISKYFLCIKSCFLYKVDFFFKAQNLSKKNQVPIYEFLVIRGETQGQFVFSVKKTEICPDFLFRSLTDQISNETLLTNNPFFFFKPFSCSKNNNPKNTKLCRNKFTCFFLL